MNKDQDSYKGQPNETFLSHGGMMACGHDSRNGVGMWVLRGKKGDWAERKIGRRREDVL